MAKRARQRISYVIDNDKTSDGGHRLGINGLAIDAQNDILYSGGRDGIVCAWDVNLSRRDGVSVAIDSDEKEKTKQTTRFRSQIAAHMHWINDITLAQNNTAVVTASSDLAVKIWRPYSEEGRGIAHTIGQHTDFVKVVAAPPASAGANWIASGGLDRKVCLWDLGGGGKTLEIDVRGEEVEEKGSVYALSVGRNIMASGGPEKVMRLHDPRTGDQVSKMVGHLGTIKSILIDEAGDTILSASTDKTIKMWSIKGGRCMYTFTMHDESIWSLFSNDPTLGIFYSSDRGGLVAKTDIRGSLEDVDDGLSVAVAREHCGVGRIVAANGYVWTATNLSSINRWEDFDTDDLARLPESIRRYRASPKLDGRSKEPSQSPTETPSKKEIPAQSVLRISNTAVLPVRDNLVLDNTASTGPLPRKGSDLLSLKQDPEVQPIYSRPADTIEGQFGLLKHQLLNDRRRILTLDTAGDVVMWDLIKCVPIQHFGKQDIEDVFTQVNTHEALAPWCSIDLSSGNLTISLEPFNCFDAEIYADELELDEPVQFRDDQRIILGKWVLRYLFANLIDEEIRRDEAYRQKLNSTVEKRQAATRVAAPISIALPPVDVSTWQELDSRTPRGYGNRRPATTPGLAIGVATPGLAVHDAGTPSTQAEKKDDYFSTSIAPANGTNAPAAAEATDGKTTEAANDKTKEKDKAGETAKSPTAFSKKFRMSFGSKKLSRSGSHVAQDKPTVGEDKAEESESSSTNEKEVEDSFYGVLQKIRNEYDKQLAEAPHKFVETKVTPSLPIDTPVLKLPPKTKVILQEETSGSSANIYQGTVETLGRDADIVEQKGAMWLGDLLLMNLIPLKEPIKVSFVLHPMDGLPPLAASEPNSRLNANRMLRVRKILAYVAERIETPPNEPETDAMKPEDYLELYCNERLVDPNMTLSTLRTHVWRAGNDVVLYYKANGRKEIRLLSESAMPGSGSQAETNDEPLPGTAV